MKRKSSELFMSFSWVKVARFQVDCGCVNQWTSSTTRHSAYSWQWAALSVSLWVCTLGATFRCHCRASGFAIVRRTNWSHRNLFMFAIWMADVAVSHILFIVGMFIGCSFPKDLHWNCRRKSMGHWKSLERQRNGRINNTPSRVQSTSESRF